MLVRHWDHDDEQEATRSPSCDLHGHIGGLDDIEPDTTRPRIGFRMTERQRGFPRGPALSFDGKTWEPL